MEDFEYSLQVLRGFQTDITAEVNEIKVINSETLVFSYNRDIIFFLRHAGGLCTYKHTHTTHSVQHFSFRKMNTPLYRIKLDHDLNPTTPSAMDMR
jgi:hypothetical protein